MSGAPESPPLRAGLAELGIDAGFAPALERYLAAIEEWNPAYGLVGASGDTLVVKHLLDSLAPFSIVRARSPRRLADIGTGAGLPGIPLSICMPGVRVSLVERMGKRCRFLRAMLDAIPLPDCEVVEAQIEEVKASFDTIVFRAFRPFERSLFKKVLSRLEPGGAAIAWKGRREKTLAELPAIDGLHSGAEILPVKVPFLDDERCVVVIRR